MWRYVIAITAIVCAVLAGVWWLGQRPISQDHVTAYGNLTTTRPPVVEDTQGDDLEQTR